MGDGDRIYWTYDENRKKVIHRIVLESSCGAMYEIVPAGHSQQGMVHIALAYLCMNRGMDILEAAHYLVSLEREA